MDTSGEYKDRAPPPRLISGLSTRQLPDLHKLAQNIAALQEAVHSSTKTLRDGQRMDIAALQDDLLKSLKAWRDEHREDVAALRKSLDNLCNDQAKLSEDVKELISVVKGRRRTNRFSSSM